MTDTERICSIRWELLPAKGDPCVAELSCGHEFFREDLVRYLQRKAACPLCRANVENVEETFPEILNLPPLVPPEFDEYASIGDDDDEEDVNMEASDGEETEDTGKTSTVWRVHLSVIVKKKNYK